MSDLLLYVVTGLLVINLIVLIIIMNTRPTGSLIKIEAGLEAMEKNIDKLNRTVMEEMLQNREELAGSIKLFNEMIASKCRRYQIYSAATDIFSQQLTNLNDKRIQA